MTTTEMVYIVLALIVGLLALLTLTAIASVIRNQKKKGTGQVPTYSANSARAVDPRPRLGGAQEVQIVENGRSGSVYYFETGQTLKLYWELGGADALVTVWAPSEVKWDAQVPWAAGRRAEVLNFIVEQVCKQKAPKAKVRWSKDFFELVNG